MQVYAIPQHLSFTVLDPMTDHSTILIANVNNASGQLVGHGYVLSATATQGSLSYSIVPSNTGLSLATSDNPLNVNVTIFYANSQDHSVFQASNILVEKLQTTNFTVTDWQLLNSTSLTPVILQISSLNQPAEVRTYNLANGQQGLLPPDQTNGILLLTLAGLATAVAVIAVTTHVRKRRREVRQKPA
jgi:hypothetical protein